MRAQVLRKIEEDLRVLVAREQVDDAISVSALLFACSVAMHRCPVPAPLVNSAWITALVFSALNAVLLRERIRVENRALASLR